MSSVESNQGANAGMQNFGQKLEQLQWKTVAASDALSGNDFVGSVFAQRHLVKLISDRLLRQRNDLQQNRTSFGDN